MYSNRLIKIFGVLAAAFFVAYMFISSPNGVVVTETGEINGLINKARESLQGKRFWKLQLVAIDAELSKLFSEPARQTKLKQELAELNQEMNRALNEWNQFMDELYRKHPDLPDRRPTPAERYAEALRAWADRIEQAEMERRFEKIRLDRIARLQNTRHLVKERAQ